MSFSEKNDSPKGFAIPYVHVPFTPETLVEEAGSNAKRSEVSKEDVLEEDVAIALEMVNTGSFMFRAVNLMSSFKSKF